MDASCAKASYTADQSDLNYFGHVHASFLHATQLHCIRCKKLVPEKTCKKETTEDVQVDLYKILAQDS